MEQDLGEIGGGGRDRQDCDGGLTKRGRIQGVGGVKKW